MLKTDPNALILDSILGMIGQVNKNNFIPEIIKDGIILIPHFSGNHYLQNYKDWIEELSINEYGVCDNYMQILEQCPELENDPKRQFLITLTPVKRKNQPASGGWRWHKWGPYIGTKNPRHEYLYDEYGIEEVFVYHIYEKNL